MNRIVEPELLDTLSPADPRAERSRRDLRRVNAWMRNHDIMARALEQNWNGRSPKQITELGAGDGNFLLAVAKKMSSRWPDVNVTLLDRQENISAGTLAAYANFGWRAEAVVADVFDWPPIETEIVVANLFLHHFENARLLELLGKISPAPVCSWPSNHFALPVRFYAAACFVSQWLHHVTLHDAALSIRAGFMNHEIPELWPDKENWRLTEHRTGFFSHLFIAQKNAAGSLSVKQSAGQDVGGTLTMRPAKPVTIVGGGLAGLTLGIALREKKIPVTIHEAGNYPRHRVCGEFISGRGQATLARLGLRDLFDAAGAVLAQTAAFFSATRSTPPRPLPSAAICLSRFTLDAILAKRFRELGGELTEGERFVRDFDEGVVRATGRRAQVEQGGTRWFGLKIHARNVPLTADLEMHISPRGYVGLCKINDDEVNVCGLFRKHSDESGGKIKSGANCCMVRRVRLWTGGWPARSSMKNLFAPWREFPCDRSRPPDARRFAWATPSR